MKIGHREGQQVQPPIAPKTFARSIFSGHTADHNMIVVKTTNASRNPQDLPEKSFALIERGITGGTGKGEPKTGVRESPSLAAGLSRGCFTIVKHFVSFRTGPSV